MRRLGIPAILILLLSLSIYGCGEDVKHQLTFRGRWELQARQIAGGEELKPPAVNGVLEWFPVNKEKAYVTIAFSSNEEMVQLAESAIHLSPTGVSRTDHVRVGGGYVPEPVGGQESDERTVGGQMKADEEAVVFTYEDDITFAYGLIDTALIVTHRDQTVDRWVRVADEKGLLKK